MNDEATRVAIRWRRILFSFHLLVWLVARLMVGSIDEMPPTIIYHWLSVWGFVVVGHGAVLAWLDGRDHADLPFQWMTALVQPRERRWSLVVIDAALWLLFTILIANRVIPEVTVFRYVVPLSLAWLAHTAFGILHLLLVEYAEVRDRTPKAKLKHDAFLTDEPRRQEARLLASDDGVADGAADGELIDFNEIADIAAESRKQK